MRRGEGWSPEQKHRQVWPGRAGSTEGLWDRQLGGQLCCKAKAKHSEGALMLCGPGIVRDWDGDRSPQPREEAAALWVSIWKTSWERTCDFAPRWHRGKPGPWQLRWQGSTIQGEDSLLPTLK